MATRLLLIVIQDDDGGRRPVDGRVDWIEQHYRKRLSLFRNGIADDVKLDGRLTSPELDHASGFLESPHLPSRFPSAWRRRRERSLRPAPKERRPRSLSWFRGRLP